MCHSLFEGEGPWAPPDEPLGTYGVFLMRRGWHDQLLGYIRSESESVSINP